MNYLKRSFSLSTNCSHRLHIIYSVNPSAWVLKEHPGDSANTTGTFFFPVLFFRIPEILLFSFNLLCNLDLVLVSLNFLLVSQWFPYPALSPHTGPNACGWSLAMEFENDLSFFLRLLPAAGLMTPHCWHVGFVRWGMTSKALARFIKQWDFRTTAVNPGSPV